MPYNKAIIRLSSWVTHRSPISSQPLLFRFWSNPPWRPPSSQPGTEYRLGFCRSSDGWSRMLSAGFGSRGPFYRCYGPRTSGSPPDVPRSGIKLYGIFSFGSGRRCAARTPKNAMWKLRYSLWNKCRLPSKSRKYLNFGVVPTAK
jgi:hypothetical protein